MPFVRTSKGVQGPFSVERLKALHAAGRLPSDAEWSNSEAGPWRKVSPVKRGLESPPPEPQVQAPVQARRSLVSWLIVSGVLACAAGVCAATVELAFPGTLWPSRKPAVGSESDPTLAAVDSSTEDKTSEVPRVSDPAKWRKNVRDITSDDLIFLLPSIRCDKPGTVRQDRAPLESLTTRKMALTNRAQRVSFPGDEVYKLANSVWEAAKKEECTYMFRPVEGEPQWRRITSDELLKKALSAGMSAPAPITNALEMTQIRDLTGWYRDRVRQDNEIYPDDDKARDTLFGYYMSAGRRLSQLSGSLFGAAEISAWLCSDLPGVVDQMVDIVEVDSSVKGQAGRVRRSSTYKVTQWDIDAMTASEQVINSLLSYARCMRYSQNVRLLCSGVDGRGFTHEKYGSVKAVYDYLVEHQRERASRGLTPDDLGAGRSSRDALVIVGSPGMLQPLLISDSPEWTLDLVLADNVILYPELREIMTDAVCSVMARNAKKWLAEGKKDWDSTLEKGVSDVNLLKTYLTARDALLLNPFVDTERKGATWEISPEALKPLAASLERAVLEEKSADEFSRLPEFSSDELVAAFQSLLKSQPGSAVPLIYTTEGWSQYGELCDLYADASRVFRNQAMTRDLGVRIKIDQPIKPQGLLFLEGRDPRTGEEKSCSVQDGDLVVLEGQNSGAWENGTWVVRSGNWTRLCTEALPPLTSPEMIYDPAKMLDEQETLYGWSFRSVLGAKRSVDVRDLVEALIAARKQRP